MRLRRRPARAGLQFIILTDHGDGTREPDAPAYRGGVLTIDGVELNTTGGHYAAFGLPPSPYPIAGTPADVIDDVHRLGGFGFAAHPGSPRPSLSWQDWQSPIDGLEWINADSEWRDEPRLPIARALLTYLIRAPESMAHAARSSRQRAAAMGCADGHAPGCRSRRHRRARAAGIPAADRSGRLVASMSRCQATSRRFARFRITSSSTRRSRATPPRTRNGSLDAIRRGRVYSVIDALATPGRLTFHGDQRDRMRREMGESLAIDGDVMLHASASAPPGTTLVLLRNGQRVHEVTDGPLETNGGKDPGVYRIEAYTANAPGGPPVPWIVSNPIYAGLGIAAGAGGRR